MKLLLFLPLVMLPAQLLLPFDDPSLDGGEMTYENFLKMVDSEPIANKIERIDSFHTFRDDVLEGQTWFVRVKSEKITRSDVCIYTDIYCLTIIHNRSRPSCIYGGIERICSGIKKVEPAKLNWYV